MDSVLIDKPGKVWYLPALEVKRIHLTTKLLRHEIQLIKDYELVDYHDTEIIFDNQSLVINKVVYGWNEYSDNKLPELIMKGNQIVRSSYYNSIKLDELINYLFDNGLTATKDLINFRELKYLEITPSYNKPGFSNCPIYHLFKSFGLIFKHKSIYEKYFRIN